MRTIPVSTIRSPAREVSVVKIVFEVIIVSESQASPVSSESKLF